MTHRRALRNEKRVETINRLKIYPSRRQKLQWANLTSPQRLLTVSRIRVEGGEEGAVDTQLESSLTFKSLELLTDVDPTEIPHGGLSERRMSQCR